MAQAIEIYFGLPLAWGYLFFRRGLILQASLPVAAALISSWGLWSRSCIVPDRSNWGAGGLSPVHARPDGEQQSEVVGSGTWGWPWLGSAGRVETVSRYFLSQVKINVTNAYSGSLSWSNFFSRLTHAHPGRVVWLVFHLIIALVLQEMGVFDMLLWVLGFYSNVAIAWREVCC